MDECSCKKAKERIEDLQNLIDELTIENADLRSQLDYYEGLNLDRI